MIVKNALVFQEDGTFVKKSVIAENGCFVRPEQASPSSFDEEIDGDGLYAIPGLTDVHFHGCNGHDFCDASEESIQAMADFELANGITQICPATMTFDEPRLINIAKAAAAHKNGKGADLVGINMEGPFISMEKRGAQNPAYVHKPDIEMFRRIQAASGNLFKLVDLAPETEGAMEFIDALKDEVTLSIAHTSANYEEAKKAIEHGVHHVTHLYNAMAGLSHRDPGVVGAVADDPEVMAELICDGHHIHPCVVRDTLRMFGEDHIVMISDSMEATGLPEGEYELGGQAVTVKDHLARLHNGTIAGAASTLMDCLRTTVKTMGIPLGTAVKLAAVNSAKSIGIYDRYGSISSGKRANFVLLDKDLNIVSVFKDGKKV